MNSCFLNVMVMLIILLCIPVGIIAAEPVPACPYASIQPEDRPCMIMSGWNTLLSGIPGSGGVFTNPDAVSSVVTATGKESPLIDQLLLGNLEFRKNIFDADPARYQDLAMAQYPGVLWIGCSDSRADPERITGAPPGELFVTRNVGNIIPNHDWNLAAVIEYSLNYLGIKEIVVCGHSDCGAMKALDADLHDPYIPLWLNDARDAKTRVDARIPDPTTTEEKKVRSREIEIENVRLQIEHLITYPSVSQAIADGRIQVHGLYYDLVTGTLSRVT
jgi:carbonic anhydrase